MSVFLLFVQGTNAHAVMAAGMQDSSLMPAGKDVAWNRRRLWAAPPVYSMTVHVSVYKRDCRFATRLTSATLAFVSDHQASPIDVRCTRLASYLNHKGPAAILLLVIFCVR